MKSGSSDSPIARDSSSEVVRSLIASTSRSALFRKWP